MLWDTTCTQLQPRYMKKIISDTSSCLSRKRLSYLLLILSEVMIALFTLSTQQGEHLYKGLSKCFPQTQQDYHELFLLSFLRTFVTLRTKIINWSFVTPRSAERIKLGAEAKDPDWNREKAMGIKRKLTMGNRLCVDLFRKARIKIQDWKLETW